MNLSAWVCVCARNGNRAKETHAEQVSFKLMFENAYMLNGKPSTISSKRLNEQRVNFLVICRVE